MINIWLVNSYVVALSRVQVSRDGWKEEQEQARKKNEAAGIRIG